MHAVGFCDSFVAKIARQTVRSAYAARTSEQQFIVCLIIVVVVFYLGASALAFWLLPLWLAFVLVAIAGILLLWLFRKIRGFAKDVRTRWPKPPSAS